jgi:hypothetical protein
MINNRGCASFGEGQYTLSPSIQSQCELVNDGVDDVVSFEPAVAEGAAVAEFGVGVHHIGLRSSAGET